MYIHKLNIFAEDGDFQIFRHFMDFVSAFSKQFGTSVLHSFLVELLKL